jgi:flagellar basal-body rod modification protein FlgD
MTTISSATSVSASAAGSSATSLTLQDFLNVLLTQLTYQDPLKPMDNQEFMAQIAQFTGLEQAQETNTNIAKLLNNQSSLQSVGLIGRTVDVTTDSGPATGTVSALSLSGTSPTLTITTSTGTLTDIDLSRITAVR